MPLTELIFGAKSLASVGAAPPLRFGVLQFDASIAETHTDEAEITEHTIEDGSNTADHIRLLPNNFEMVGMITNTPLVYLASVQAKSPIQGSLLPVADRVDEAYAFLRQLQADGVICDVSTSLRDYSDMAIQILVVRREAKTGQALDITIGFKELKKSKALSIKLPVPIQIQNKKPTNKGTKSKTDSGKNAKKSVSALKQIVSF